MEFNGWASPRMLRYCASARHSYGWIMADQSAACPAVVGGRGRYASGRTDVLCLRSLLPLGRLEFDLLVLIQRPVAGACDRGEVDEYVRRPVIGSDETKALIGVEPLHCACCHQSKPLTRHAAARSRRTDRESTGPGSGLPRPQPRTARANALHRHL
jgi:hypothetical protein